MRIIWKKTLRLAAAMTLVAAAASATALPVSIANHSFEDPSLVDGGFTVGTVTGWTVFGTSGVFNPTVGQLAQGPTDGFQVAYSNNTGLALTQDLAATLMANTFYSLMVDVQSRTDGVTHKSSTLQLRTVTDDILASATVGPLAGGTNFLLTANFSASAFDVNLGKNLRIALISGGGQSDWDNVRLDATPLLVVPEPSSFLLALVGMGLAGVVGAKRRRST